MKQIVFQLKEPEDEYLPYIRFRSLCEIWYFVFSTKENKMGLRYSNGVASKIERGFKEKFHDTSG